MTVLKLREGWVEDDDGSCILIYPPGGRYLNAYAAVVPWDTSVDSYVVVYPHGKMHVKKHDLGGRRFKTVKDAHEYLIRVGSESPWEVTP